MGECASSHHLPLRIRHPIPSTTDHYVRGMPLSLMPVDLMPPSASCGIRTPFLRSDERASPVFALLQPFTEAAYFQFLLPGVRFVRLEVEPTHLMSSSFSPRPQRKEKRPQLCLAQQTAAAAVLCTVRRRAGGAFVQTIGVSVVSTAPC